MIINNLYIKKEFEIFVPDTSSKIDLPFLKSLIPAGFPSPADDYMEMSLDLNEKLIRNPSSTFFAQISGSSMINAGICDGDIVIVDKSLQPKNDSILVCIVDGEFTLKKFKKIDEETAYLMPDNPEFDPIKISKHNNFMIWGVVTYTIHKQH
ncbi:MAG: translesion error-prone DNA polymerase V autoproteolytic subunit [Bacteroidales bacterium]|nr:translesion error-prone DNA polymerase V autoproteolytic subunit [Bacteroidales bacterium]